MLAEELKQRRLRVANELAERNLDALIISFGPNIRYLTGFTGSSALVLVARDETILFTDPRYRIQAAQEVSCKVSVASGTLTAQLLVVLRKRNLRRVGFEPARMSYEEHEFLKSRLPLRTTIEPLSGLIEQYRMIKSQHEISLVRDSVQANSQAFERALGRFRLGMRETDLAAELEYQIRRCGAERAAFDTIVAAGTRSALPHAQPGDARIGANSLVLVDMGGSRRGYASDMTRMLFTGHAGKKIKQIYRAVLEAQHAAIASVRPGVKAMDVDRAARRILSAEKLDGAFVHSTGHGLGLHIHEPPRLGKKEKMPLQEGMAITIEPGVYLQELGGIRIEDTVVVTRNGCEVLTPTPKELREV